MTLLQHVRRESLLLIAAQKLWTQLNENAKHSSKLSQERYMRSSLSGSPALQLSAGSTQRENFCPAPRDSMSVRQLDIFGGSIILVPPFIFHPISTSNCSAFPELRL